MWLGCYPRPAPEFSRAPLGREQAGTGHRTGAALPCSRGGSGTHRTATKTQRHPPLGMDCGPRLGQGQPGNLHGGSPRNRCLSQTQPAAEAKRARPPPAAPMLHEPAAVWGRRLPGQQLAASPEHPPRRQAALRGAGAAPPPAAPAGAR